MSSTLLQLVSLILEGGKSAEMPSQKLSRISTNIAQLIRFNSIKQQRRGEVKQFRHSQKNEPPLPVSIALMVHVKTRKKALVNQLASEGLCISYERVKSIEKRVLNQLCTTYQREQIVCPPKLQHGVFTSSAIDNIDHNLTSVTATSSFHGTSISIFQHPEAPVELQPMKLTSLPPTRVQRLQLPAGYTNIKPTKGGKPEPPVSKTINRDLASQIDTAKEACAWTEKLASHEGSIKDRVCFSAYYSQKATTESVPSITQLLPLLPDAVHTPAMVRHCTQLFKEITEKLNPGQQPVITADQPVYALGKQVQWMFPAEFIDIVWMMGPLHIEMAFLNVLGDWLSGSGWCIIFEKSNVSTAGKIESFLKGNHVKRSRYAHQLSLASLVKLAKIAFDKQTVHTSYNDWKNSLSKKCATANYWFTVIDLEKKLFMFVRSLREAKFHLFVSCVDDLIPWLFALDHVNYARWLPVFVHDLKQLPAQKTYLKNSVEGILRSKKVIVSSQTWVWIRHTSRTIKSLKQTEVPLEFLTMKKPF